MASGVSGSLTRSTTEQVDEAILSEGFKVPDFRSAEQSEKRERRGPMGEGTDPEGEI